MAAAQTHSPLARHIRVLGDHFDSLILPMWMGPGFNQTLGLPYESLDAASGRPLPPVRYRAMACARQLYVFSNARAPGAREHAGRLFESLTRTFRNAEHGGWRFSVDAEGKPLDDTQDLYTHAFVVFACAAYFRSSRAAQARRLMLETAEHIEAHFRTGDELYASALGADWRRVVRGPAQNPMMHLTESYLAAAQIAEPALFAQRLRRLGQAVAAAFLHPPSQCIAEEAMGTADNRLEPGHQFEWMTLVHGAQDVYDGLELPDFLPRGVAWARRHGVDDGSVRAALDMRGGVLDDTRRIWAQTEYLRMLAATGDLAALEPALVRFNRDFLHPGGWHECLDGQGQVTRGDMPSTSPYHLATCLEELQNVIKLAR